MTKTSNLRWAVTRVWRLDSTYGKDHDDTRVLEQLYIDAGGRNVWIPVPTEIVAEVNVELK